MMRRLFVVTTTAFWMAVAAFWIGSLSSPIAQQPAAPATTDRAISAAELAQHATPETCWMAIRGGVYDLAAYLPDHPSRPQIIEPWCGKEATEAYATKTKGRAHTREADELLPKYRIGRFAP
jgi:cytochrome b involved in lipid metabolism|uniref:Cytochrome b5 n=1 Tax=Rhodopseudomonas palustris (strain BisA53) TaxID=316055 RepID=Q07P44_RHOP5